MSERRKLLLLTESMSNSLSCYRDKRKNTSHPLKPSSQSRTAWKFAKDEGGAMVEGLSHVILSLVSLELVRALLTTFRVGGYGLPGCTLY